MAGIKSLVKDTAIYGVSSIFGRFLNWALNFLYLNVFADAAYGDQSFLYSITAVLLMVLTYGMETGFFRYANKEGHDPDSVYSTSLISVGTTSLVFIVLLAVFLNPIALLLKQSKAPEFVLLLGITVAIDAFSNIPFAYLRYKNRPVKFATIKLLNIGFTIALNLFFLLWCPVIARGSAAWLVNWFYLPLGGASFTIGWVFVANLMATGLVFLCLTPYFVGKIRSFDFSLLRRMLSYSWPILVLGIAGSISHSMGQIMIPYLFEGQDEAAKAMVGVYNAGWKIAVVLVMFSQAFRYAYEPFIFSQSKNKGEEKLRVYSEAMKYYVIFGFFIFLGVMYFLPVMKHLIKSDFWDGLKVVPVVMAAEIFSGIFFNLSIWYKLTDRTRWGMYFSLICFAVMFGLNLWFVPAIGIPGGYMGSAWAAVIGYFVVMVLSYLVGRKYYPVPYPLLKLGKYASIAVLLYVVGEWMYFYDAMWLTYLSRVVLLGGYCAVVYFGEFASTKGIRLA